MSRLTIDEICRTLVDLNGPIGPFGDPETSEKERIEFTESLWNEFREDYFDLYYLFKKYLSPYRSEDCFLDGLDSIFVGIKYYFPKQFDQFLEENPNHIIWSRLDGIHESLADLNGKLPFIMSDC